MKIFGKFFCIILSVLIVLSCNLNVFAQSSDVNQFVRPNDVKVQILNKLTDKEEKYNQNLLEKASILRGEEKPIAELTLFGTADGPASSTNTSGHVWLYIYNWSSTSFTIGNKVVSPKTGITVGTFGNQGYNGVWYNLESLFPKHTNYSYTSEITSRDIISISNYVKSHDDWQYLYNCSHFAAGAWNSTSLSKKFTGGTPSQVVPQIKAMRGFVVNKLYPVSGSVSHN